MEPHRPDETEEETNEDGNHQSLITSAVVILMNFAGWIWGMVAGFRSGPLWGFLNLCFYPICPLIYGFAIRRDLGRRAALWAFFWTLALVGGGLWASAMPGK